jgi:tRNA(adenine34) deaminase
MAYAREMRDLAIAAGDHAYGAVIVMEGRVIGLGPSRVIVGTDPTAHAEIEAIRDAARRLGMRSLAGATLYSTSRPCRMCESAASYAHLSEFFFGDSLVAGGRPRSA